MSFEKLGPENDHVIAFTTQVNALPSSPSLSAVMQLLALVSANFDVNVVAAIVMHAESQNGGGWKEILTQIGAQADKIFPNPMVASTARTLLMFCAHFLKLSPAS